MSRVVSYLFSALLIAGFAAATSEPRKPETGRTKQIDQEATKAVNAVSEELRSKVKISSGTILVPVSYTVQIGVENRYFVKIRLGAGESAKYIHAKIYKFLMQKDKYSLENTKEASVADPIVYFE